VEDLHPANIAGLLEALDEDEKQELFRQLDTDTASKETWVGLLMTLVCGLTLGVAAEVCQRNPALRLTVGVSMAMVIMVASFMGSLIPVIFQRLGIHPAVPSGPFVNIASDLSGIVIDLSLSTAILKYIVR